MHVHIVTCHNSIRRCQLLVISSNPRPRLLLGFGDSITSHNRVSYITLVLLDSRLKLFKVIVQIPCSDALEEWEYIQEALMDAIESRSVDAFTDPQKSQNTTYYLMKLLRAIMPSGES